MKQTTLKDRKDIKRSECILNRSIKLVSCMSKLIFFKLFYFLYLHAFFKKLKKRFLLVAMIEISHLT